MENRKFLIKYIHTLKFDLGLDVVFINDDEELINILMGELRDVKKFKEEYDDLKEQFGELKDEYDDLKEEFENFKGCLADFKDSLE